MHPVETVPICPSSHAQSANSSEPAGDTVLTPHDVHAALPAVSLYVPVPHCSHSDVVLSGVNPALHTQAVTSVLAAGDVESLGQSSQAALPRAALYVPGLHSAHGPPSGPEKPALQTHAVAAVLPAGDVLEARHPPHAALPACSLYVPTAHSVHAPPPVYPALQVHAATDELCAGELES